MVYQSSKLGNQLCPNPLDTINVLEISTMYIFRPPGMRKRMLMLMFMLPTLMPMHMQMPMPMQILLVMMPPMLLPLLPLLWCAQGLSNTLPYSANTVPCSSNPGHTRLRVPT